MRNSIKIIEEKEAKGQPVSTEDLAEFFKVRGF